MKSIQTKAHVQDQDSDSRKDENFMIELSQKPAPDTPATLVTAPDLSVPEPDNDHFRCKIPLPYRAVVYPLVFAVEVITNEETVLAIVDELWGGLRQLHKTPLLQIRIVVSEG